MRLRQVALVARELEPAVDDLCAVLGIDVCYRDPAVAAFGLHNALMPLGDTFLEVVSPNQPGTTAERLLEKRGGEGGYMAIFQVPRLAPERARVEALGVRVVWSADLPDAKAVHLHPRDVGGAIVSLDEMDPPESWKWAGPDWRSHLRTDRVRDIVGVEIQSADPQALARRWAQVLGAEARSENGAWNVPVQGGLCRFVPDRDGRGEGLAAVLLRVNDPEAIRQAARQRNSPHDDTAVTLCGTRFVLT